MHFLNIVVLIDADLVDPQISRNNFSTQLKQGCVQVLAESQAMAVDVDGICS